jgi:heat shock protein HslJ
MGLKTIAANVAVAICLIGCGGAGRTQSAQTQAKEKAARNPLADTAWRLVEFQSMDDPPGVKKPDDSSKYTLHLKADGSVSLRLNCNSATGSWKSEPSADGSSGKFQFRPLAATAALCPPPSMDDVVTRQSQFIRSYLLKDGRLYLSLLADGGVFAWEPIPAAVAATQPDAELEAAILAASPSYTKQAVDGPGTMGRARYAVAKADLNGDGAPEVFVYMMGSIFCGTGGCNLLLFTRGPSGYRLVDSFPITRTPLVIAESSNIGWKDVWKWESGGGAPATLVRFVFNGTRYVEKERATPESEPAGKTILGGEVTFQTGTPLAPPH